MKAHLLFHLLKELFNSWYDICVLSKIVYNENACWVVSCGALLWLIHCRIPLNKCTAWVLITEQSAKITKTFKKPFSFCSVCIQRVFSPALRYFTAPTRTSSGSRGTLACMSSDFLTHTKPAGLWIWPDTLSIICSHTSATWPRINATSLPTGGSGNLLAFCSLLFCL